jgi:hypothetical protein
MPVPQRVLRLQGLQQVLQLLPPALRLQAPQLQVRFLPPALLPPALRRGPLFLQVMPRLLFL